MSISNPTDGPPSALPASKAWKGRGIKLVLLGKTHINGKSFTESYNMTIDAIEDPVSVSCAIRAALAQAAPLTSIPGDLLEGVEFRFIKPDTSAPL